MYAPDTGTRVVSVAPETEYPAQSQPSAPLQNEAATQGSGKPARFTGAANNGGIGYGSSNGANSSRNRNANQVIRRGVGGNDPTAQLPLGTVIPAKLISNVLSTNTSSPVMALTLKDAESPTGISLPQGSKLIGNSTFDEASRRIQIQFYSVIYEDGTQHSIQGLAVMPDGSSGLDGDYHSGEGKRQLGSFLTNFVGGLADGMKDRSSSGGLMGSYEPGSIKNGLLNGVSTSASDEAKHISDGLSNEKPSMTVTSGFPFLLFLQKEYVP